MADTANVWSPSDASADLFWISTKNYKQYAVVIGSNGTLYQAVIANKGVDPVTDTNNTTWSQLVTGGGSVAVRTTVTLEAGQTEIILPANISVEAIVLYVVSDGDVDRGRLNNPDNYNVNINSNIITLVESYPAGTKIVVVS